MNTEAIKTNLIPEKISKTNKNIIYANEADILNIALFGVTAKEWRDKNPNKQGNIRDYASVEQLVCLSNLESMNALFISQGIDKEKRVHLLNEVAIQQMLALVGNTSVKKLN